MSLTILNNVTALTAQNSLALTSANLQKTLQQLSTGLKINSGADDAAGLSIASGLQANIAALVQSQNNANNGIGFLQIADGALSQVTSLLNRAVTLATESANSGLTTNQRGAANTEYQSILNEIDQIGSVTQFNGTQVFADGNNAPVALANNGSTVTGTINPLDTLSGGFTVTSTVPAVHGGAPTPDTFTDSGTSSSATIASGSALTGSITINATVPASSGTPQNINFTASYPFIFGSTLTSSAITPGATLSGSLTFTNAVGTQDIVDLTGYADLASNWVTRNALATDLNTHLGGSGSSYSVSMSGSQLSITTNSPQIAFAGVTNTETSAVPIQTGDVLHGQINIGTGGKYDLIDMSDPRYAGLTSSDPTARTTALANLGADLTLYMSDATIYTASLDGSNHLVFTSQPGKTLSIAFTDTFWQEAASPFTSAAQQAVGTLQTTTPTTVSIAGIATSSLQSYLQTQFGTDYNVSFNQGTGALSIALNSNLADGVTSFTTTGSSVEQSIGGTPAVNTPTAVDLTGVTTANLQSSLLTQLGGAGGHYTVAYNSTTGALSFGISSAGTSAGITSIASSANNAVESVPSGTTGLSAFNVFTSDGTGSGTSVDVTVGSLSKANVGASNGDSGVDLSASDLLSQSSAASTLTLITAAVNGISSQRGEVGANINRLTATVSVEGTTVVNLTSAMNSIQNADIGKTVANMTQYNVLQSTGMAALQQSNQAQQAVLKLIQ